MTGALIGLIAMIAGWLVGTAFGQRDTVRAEARVKDEQIRRWIATIEHDTAAHRDAIRELRIEHLREIERLMAYHKDEIDRLMNVANFGRPSLPDAERINAPADAETRVLKAIGEDTRADAITRGAEHLKQMYQEAGLVLSDEEARLQAAAMVAGESLDRIVTS